MTSWGALEFTWLSELTAWGQSGRIFIPLPPSESPPAPTPHRRKHLGARQLSVAEVIPKGVDSRGPCGPSNWATILSWKEDLSLGPSYIWVHLLSQLSKGVLHGTQVAHLSVRHFPPCPYLVTTALSPPYDEGAVPLPGR